MGIVGQYSLGVLTETQEVRMKLSEYFERAKGKGVIATADAKGKVGMAVYARPHFINEKTVAFIAGSWRTTGDGILLFLL